jgi:hypothetical protein
MEAISAPVDGFANRLSLYELSFGQLKETPSIR